MIFNIQSSANNLGVNNLEQAQEQIGPYISPWLIKIAYYLGSYWLLPLYFQKITVVGRENIPREGPLIVAPTHKSRWDALIVPYATGRLVSGRDLYFMVSANEMKGIQGWFVKRLGGFPVNIDRPGLGPLRDSFDLLCRGEMVVIFPEGGIFRDRQVHPLKRGVAKIALEVESAKPNAGCKILPLSIHYSQTIPRRGCQVEVKIGTHLEVSRYNRNLDKKDTEDLTQDLSEAIIELAQP